MKSKIGVITICVLAVLPVLLWVGMYPLTLRFGGVNQTARSLGQIAGLTGMALFSLNIVLASRWKFLEDYFNGLNRIYINHHLIGGIAFILLLIHPLMLTYTYLLLSAHQATLFILGLTQREVFFGVVALFIMIVLLVLTFFLRPAYDLWKITHKYLALAFSFALMHVLFISSDISVNSWLKGYLLILALVGIFSIFYRTLFPKYFVKRFIYLVNSVNKIAAGVFEVSLKPQSEKVNYYPGQFFFIDFLDKALTSEEDPFSVVSVAEENNITFVIKNLGDYTGKVGDIRLGTEVKLEGPFGRFGHSINQSKKQIWIAGGIGITPFISMLKSLTSKDKLAGVDLYYSTKTQAEMIYLNLLYGFQKSLANFSFKPIYTENGVRISADLIVNRIPDFADRVYYICGPRAMMRSLNNGLITKGVKSGNIHAEEFEL